MWQAITDFLLKAHASGLSHEAVIEIMIALLGVMLAVLTLVSGLFAVVIAVIGWFGYQTIKDEAKRMAKATSTRIAKSTASKIANQTLDEIWSQFQASGMSEGQAEIDQPPGRLDAGASRTEKTLRKSRRRATSDANLKQGE